MSNHPDGPLTRFVAARCPHGKGVEAMTDPLDVELQDPELQEEIRLVAELMAAAASAGAPLSQARIDELLGEAD